MVATVTIDLRQVARGLDIPLNQVQAVVELLDDGNTVPFITRYRKDQTGGLDEERIRQIQDRLEKARLLADRKQAILRSIESQGKLTEALERQILSATTTKRLEDLYLPYKPHKQSLASMARGKGLEPLAREILYAAPSCADLDLRARDFVNPDRGVRGAADALLGAGHIVAEMISERADVRQAVRDLLQRTGKLISMQAGAPSGAAPAAVVGGTIPATTAAAEPAAGTATADSATAPTGLGTVAPDAGAGDSLLASLPGAVAAESMEGPAEPVEPSIATARTSAQAVEPPVGALEPAVASIEPSTGAPAPPTGAVESCIEAPEAAILATAGGAPAEAGTAPRAEPPAEPCAESCGKPPVEAVAAPAPAEVATDTPGVAEHGGQSGATAVSSTAVSAAVPASRSGRSAGKAAPSGPAKPPRPTKRELRKKKEEERKIKAFRDYFHYSEALRKIPPHRILAINRGERAQVLRVRVEADTQAMAAAVEQLVVPPGHPHGDYLRGCARDALERLILPSLEREWRRELTDRAEAHAVEVFAKNLRNLLLQPPVRGRRVLAIDPGFKSGCKLAALDQFGNVLAHDVIYLVGKSDRRQEARQKVVELVRRFGLTVIAVGNGTACRQTEDFVAELISTDLKDCGVRFAIVNEAGASVYSTSRLGREEFPDYDASLRGAISIGRRLQDPLSELVKIEPANIGVGLYQHDVRAKHLRSSLDEVVESCVNYVGVDVNTASPELLRYVSGLNQLTARRIYDHRRQRGPFRNREQLRDVPGIGEATFVQAAGFLKIASGDNPLDATWIHPESYAAAARVLEKLECTPADLTHKEKIAALSERIARLDRAALAEELQVGRHTLDGILESLARPGRDPREDLPGVVFKQGVLRLEDLQPGMELTGTVSNVVDFGAFVDIGMHDSGLVHVSQLADRFIRDPHEFVSVGDVVKVWVREVDKQRRRVSLTMIPPGTERQRGPRRSDESETPADGQRAARPSAGRPRRGGERRPPSGAARGGTVPGAPVSGEPEVGSPGGEPTATPPASTARRSEGGPPPRQQRRYHDRPPRGRREGDSRGYQPKPRPKPIIPITEKMKQGKEPMRTFSDLLQFYQAREGDPTGSASAPPTGGKPSRSRGGPPAPPAPQPAAEPTEPAEPSPPSTESSPPPPGAAAAPPSGAAPVPPPGTGAESPSGESPAPGWSSGERPSGEETGAAGAPLAADDSGPPATT